MLPTRAIFDSETCSSTLRKSRCHIGKAGPKCANGLPPMCAVLWMATSVSHHVRLCQRWGTGWPVSLMTPRAQGDAVVFIFSTASLSRAVCSVVAAPIERRMPAGGGGGAGGGVAGGRSDMQLPGAQVVVL